MTSGSSLRNTAYRELKSAIITAQYEGGTFLNVASLTKDLGIGRTPIHEAIMRLELDGLVEVMPRKGVMVRPATLAEVRDIAEARKLNEAYCASKAAECADKKAIETLDTILKESGEAIKDLDVDKALLLDRQFHSAISKIAGNRVLADVLAGIQERSHRYWYLSFSSVPHMERVQVQHMEIFDGIRNHDPVAAAEASKMHVEKFLENVVSLF